MALIRSPHLGFIVISLLSSTSLFPQQWGWQQDDLTLNPSGLDLLDVTSWAWGDLNGDDIADVVLLRDDGTTATHLEFWKGLQSTNPPYWIFEPDFFKTINDSASDGLSLADLDGDGIPNIITFRHQTSLAPQLLHWQKEPDGVWRPDTTFFAGLSFNPPESGNSDPIFADIDEDGDLDMLIRDMDEDFFGGEGFRFFENVGDLNTPVWVEDAAPVEQLNNFLVGFTPRSGVIMDADGDGLMDVIVEAILEANPHYFFYIGVKDSSGFHWVPAWENLKIDKPDHGSRKLWAFDIDRDGMLDLLHLERGGTARIFLTDTTSTENFNPNYFRLGAIGFSSDNFQAPAYTIPFDYNRDNRIEILAVGFFYDFTFIFASYAYEKDFLKSRLLWRNTHWFTLSPFRYNTNSSHSFLDIDQNNNVDFILSGLSTNPASKPEIKAYENPDVNLQDDWIRNDGLVARFRRQHPDTVYFDQTFGDLDGDSDKDILITELIRAGTDSGKTHHVFFENHSSSDSVTWMERPDWKAGLPEKVYPAVTLTDLDRDGDVDLVFGTSTGTLHYYENVGNISSPTWRLRDDVFSGIDVATAASPAFADLDDDGQLDLLLGTDSGKIVFYRNVSTVGVTPNKTEPLSFKLLPNFPNPFNPSTTIRFTLPKQSEVSLKIYNIRGREMTTLVAQVLQAGNYEVDFEASKLASGVYIYRLETNQGFVQTKKLMVLK